MFLYKRLALFFGLSLSVMLLSAPPEAQAQMLELDELEGPKESSDQSEDAALGGIAPVPASLESQPILFGQSVGVALDEIAPDFVLPEDHSTLPSRYLFKPTDRSAFSAETNDFLWTLPVKSISQTDAADDKAAVSQRACLIFSNSSAADPDSIETTGTLPFNTNNFRLALSGDCMPDAEEVVGFLRGVASLMTNADLQEAIVCFFEESCNFLQVAALNFGKSSEKVPEPTISAAIWLGVAAAGALSARFKPKSK